MDVVFCDFEYRNDGAQIILGCFDSKEHGRRAFDFRLKSDRELFSIFFKEISDSLWCSFYGPAELQSLLTLGYDISSIRFVDAMYEARMITITHSDHFKRQANLLASLHAFGVSTTTNTAHKEEMRDLILGTDQYTDDEWNSIKEYCWEDVDVLPPLMHAIRKFHEEVDDGWTLAEAEHRGKYIRAISQSDYYTAGFPIDVELMNRVFDNKQGIVDHLAKQVNSNHDADVFKFFPGKTKRDGTVIVDRYGFSGTVFSKWIDGQIKGGYISDWDKTESGRTYSTDKEYMKAQAVHYPHIKDIKEAKSTLNALGLRDLRELLHDGYIKCNTRAFKAVTGRNGMPPSEGYILGAPKWMRSFIRPHPGKAFIGSDWSQQEIGLAAFLSGDESLRDIFNAGDVYWALAQRAGAIPMDIPASEKSKYPKHKLTRALYKNLQLGISYGKQVKAMSLDVRGTVVDEDGMPILSIDDAYDVAQEMFDWHKDEFQVYWDWSSDTIDEAYANGYYRTYDWTYYVDHNTRTTQLLNLPMQSMGASMMRLASIYAVDEGLDLVCSQHDALYVACDESEALYHAEYLQGVMAKASSEMLGGWIELKTDTHTYTHVHPYNDEDGEVMRLKVLSILDIL